MAQKDNSKIKYLDTHRTWEDDRKTELIISNLINLLQSKEQGIPLPPQSKRFQKAVISSYKEIYGLESFKNTNVYENAAKLC